jgi:hypothetical protein
MNPRRLHSDTIFSINAFSFGSAIGLASVCDERTAVNEIFRLVGMPPGAWVSRALRENFARPGGRVWQIFNFQGKFAKFSFGTASANDFCVIGIDSPCHSDRFGQLSRELNKT